MNLNEYIKALDIQVLKTNFDVRCEVRNFLEEKILDANTMISIPNDILELLLFETIKLNNDISIKIPIWSGDFLKYIDLSNVDFSNISFASFPYINAFLDENFYNIFNNQTDSDIFRIHNEFNQIYRYRKDKKKDSDYWIDYSGANAVDLTESFDYKYLGYCSIICCNFANAQVIFPPNCLLKIYNSDLTNVDLSNFEFNLYHWSELQNKTILKGSGARLKSGIEYALEQMNWTFKNLIEYIKKNIGNNNWTGCHLDKELENLYSGKMRKI